MRELSVIEAVKRVTELDGSVVTVYGALSLEFESQCLVHIPKSEVGDDGLFSQSSIWVNFDLETIGQSEQWLWQFDTRHVLVTGILSAPISPDFRCGHLGMWPAEMTITAIKKKAK